MARGGPDRRPTDEADEEDGPDRWTHAWLFARVRSVARRRGPAAVGLGVPAVFVALLVSTVTAFAIGSTQIAIIVAFVPLVIVVSVLEVVLFYRVSADARNLRELFERRWRRVVAVAGGVAVTSLAIALGVSLLVSALLSGHSSLHVQCLDASQTPTDGGTVYEFRDLSEPHQDVVRRSIEQDRKVDVDQSTYQSFPTRMYVLYEGGRYKCVKIHG